MSSFDELDPSNPLDLLVIRAVDLITTVRQHLMLAETVEHVAVPRIALKALADTVEEIRPGFISHVYGVIREERGGYWDTQQGGQVR